MVSLDNMRLLYETVALHSYSGEESLKLLSFAPSPSLPLHEASLCPYPGADHHLAPGSGRDSGDIISYYSSCPPRPLACSEMIADARGFCLDQDPPPGFQSPASAAFSLSDQ